MFSFYGSLYRKLIQDLTVTGYKPIIFYNETILPPRDKEMLLKITRGKNFSFALLGSNFVCWENTVPELIFVSHLIRKRSYKVFCIMLSIVKRIISQLFIQVLCLFSFVVSTSHRIVCNPSKPIDRFFENNDVV